MAFIRCNEKMLLWWFGWFIFHALPNCCVRVADFHFIRSDSYWCIFFSSVCLFVMWVFCGSIDLFSQWLCFVPIYCCYSPRIQSVFVRLRRFNEFRRVSACELKILRKRHRLPIGSVVIDDWCCMLRRNRTHLHTYMLLHYNPRRVMASCATLFPVSRSLTKIVISNFVRSAHQSIVSHRTLSASPSVPVRVCLSDAFGVPSSVHPI